MPSLASLTAHDWDLIVIGGGITGAGILREAARMGLHVLLVERKDFASGTSSHSSKLIHGGLRYLVQGQIHLMRESVQERARLLREGPHLVTSLCYQHAVYKGDRVTPIIMDLGLRAYALLHGHWKIHKHLPASAAGLYAPGLNEEGLRALFEYEESQADDARLVLRVLREAKEHGAMALNYTSAVGLLRDEHGQVIGVSLQDHENTKPIGVRARAIINATGAWADHMRKHIRMPAHLRPMRGSHLVIPGWRFRLGQVSSFFHPVNGRPIYCVPWQGVVLVGTTDVDQHSIDEDEEPRPSPDEVHFLLEGLQARFSSLGLSIHDVQAVFAGIRPVADVRTSDPTKAIREHVIWYESGLLTVTGGKLTTFHCMTVSALEELRHHLPHLPKIRPDTPALDPLPDLPTGLPIDHALALDWLARYGPESLDFLLASPKEERIPIHGRYSASLAEFRWTARHESVQHLDDLLLRRIRLGLTMPQGGLDLLPKIRPLLQSELNWTDARWDAEVDRYLTLWKRLYSVPE